MENLQVEINANFVQADTKVKLGQGVALMFPPPLDEDYWMLRVKLLEDQAIVGFPKFGTIGIGFAQEEDWNTNLPYTCPTQQIFDHIKHNKKYDEITDDTCMEAIRLIQEAAKLLK